MIKKSTLRLTLTLLLALLAAQTLNAQTARQSGQFAPLDQQRLQHVMAPTTNVEEFRQEYADYLAEMEDVLGRLLESPYAQQVMAKSGLNPQEQLAWARQKLPQLTEQELTSLKTAFAKSPDWRAGARRLDALLRPEVREWMQSLSRTRVRQSGGVTPDNCASAFKDGATMKDPRVSNTDISIASAAVLAANAIVDSLPDDFLSVAGKVVAVVARTIIEAVLLTLETLKNISDDCSGDSFGAQVETDLTEIKTRVADIPDIKTTVTNVQNKLNDNLDVKVSTRATQDSVTNVQNSVNTANASLESLKLTAGATAAGVSDVNRKLDDRLDVKVSSRSTQTSVNTLQSTANTINVKLDSALMKLDALAAALQAFQAENLRLQCELNLLLGPRYNHVQFQLPEAFGGHLELVRDVVRDRIKNSTDAGLPTDPGAISQAQAAFNIGNAYFAAKAYKDAYASYRTAYLLLSVVIGNRQP